MTIWGLGGALGLLAAARLGSIYITGGQSSTIAVSKHWIHDATAAMP